METSILQLRAVGTRLLVVCSTVLLAVIASTTLASPAQAASEAFSGQVWSEGGKWHVGTVLRTGEGNSIKVNWDRLPRGSRSSDAGPAQVRFEIRLDSDRTTRIGTRVTTNLEGEAHTLVPRGTKERFVTAITRVSTCSNCSHSHSGTLTF